MADLVRSIRFRLTGLATIVVAVALSVASAALFLVQRNALTTNLDADLTARATAIELSLAGGLNAEEVADPGNEELVVQVVDILDRVVAASPNLAGEPPIADHREGVRVVDDIDLEDAPFRVVTMETTRTTEPFTIHVGASLEDITEASAALAGTMAAAVPALVVILAALTWWLVGRALGPVEAIRAEVAEIDSRDLSRRVPVPTTGDEISRLAEMMNQMLGRLEISTSRQQRFVADASHELRSPLTRMRTMLEVDRAHPDQADPARTSEAMLEETLQMQQLVDDLLELARTDAGVRSEELRPVDLDDIVHRQADGLRAEYDLQVDIGVSPAQVMGRSSALARMVRNLTDNAARHAQSSVSISLDQHDGVVELAVSNDGPPIPGDERERIFERFARLDDARSTAHGGTGLGLAIARDIAQAHGGTIDVDDAFEQGARFVVRLPVHM